MQYTNTPYKAKCVIDADGTPLLSDTGILKQKTLLKKLYQHMVLIRQFDQRVVALQRTGQMGTYASCLGQEAIGTGIGAALSSQDVLVPYYRDQATQLWRGVTLSQQLSYWGGNEWGNHFSGDATQDFPNCVPIATQVTHAAGVASAMKIKAEKRCALTTCGEGATSRGDFYESLNLAGSWQLPLVVVVNNNQWAISVPRSIQTGAETIAQKAVAAGIEGFQVDGNDVCSVYDAVQYAVEKAHQGKGATLIEAISYRLCDHTTADDATRYRQIEEVNDAWKREPIKRLQTYLHSIGAWDHDQEQRLQDTCKQEVEAAVADYLSQPNQPIDDVFNYVFEDTPAHLYKQLDQAKQKQTHMAVTEGGH